MTVVLRAHAAGVAEGMAKAAEIALPDIETVSAKVHEAWIASKLAAGVTSRRSESGEELMRPYEKLSEPAKDLDRNTVRAVYAAILAAAPPHLVRRSESRVLRRLLAKHPEPAKEMT